MHAVAVHEHVPDAVHGLDAVHLFINLGEVHVLAVVIVVSRLLPSFLTQQLRTLHNLVAALEMLAFPEVFQNGAQQHAVGQPEDHARSHMLEEGEQAEFAAELPVVAAPGFLQPVQMVLQGLLVGKGRSINARKHAVLLVTTPVGTGNGQKTHMLTKTCVRDMGAATQVREFSFLIQGDGGGIYALQQFHLVFLSHFSEFGHGFIVGEDSAHKGKLLLGNAVHFGFNVLEIGLGEGSFHIKVVVEAIFNGGTNGHQSLGEESLDGQSHDMGSGVAQNLCPFGAVSENGLNFRSLCRHGSRQIVVLAINACSHHGLELLAAQRRLEHRGNIGSVGHRNDLSFNTDIHRKLFLLDSENTKKWGGDDLPISHIFFRRAVGVCRLSPPGETPECLWYGRNEQT